MFTQEDLSVASKCFAQAVTNFLMPSVENTKKSYVLHFNNHNSGIKHDLLFKNFNPIFLIHSLSSICWFILSLHSENFKIPFQGSPFDLYMFWSVNRIHIYLLIMAL